MDKRMIVDIDGVQLDLKVRDGVLEVGRPDKTWIGSVYVGAEPAGPTPRPATPDLTPAVPILPERWTQDPDGTIRNAEGRSIYGISPEIETES
ncbi:hypothetical protein FDH00_gp26 [Gordonia phage Attis]|uniref:Uncharacterized protein n=5 Tax=Attisvirus TaxID=2169652 RepID=A0A142K8R8_9CAUD|nr:hypothetical protein SEA_SOILASSASSIN_26 [Gordonia phage SoilAssassin]YP_009595784.1 hypothetical protein FDH00_gp26 [Gordonia phage Attis]AMS02427.1 hypothetical protein SEA_SOILASSASSIN_26 [Gordonia phage SoilAssassin]AMS02501.1 hypothetical protein SEA_ATTIS_26 [Gordonia phage Attis]